MGNDERQSPSPFPGMPPHLQLSYGIDIKPDPAVDIRALLLLQRVIIDVLYKMRPEQFVYANTREDAAVQHWLTYLSILMDIAVSAGVHLVCYRHHVAAAANLRLAMEYAARTMYYDLHPREAYFELQYAHRRRYNIAKNELVDSDLATNLRPAYEQARKDCPEIDNRKPKSMKEIFYTITGSHDFYYNGYGPASELLHGSAE